MLIMLVQSCAGSGEFGLSRWTRPRSELLRQCQARENERPPSSNEDHCLARLLCVRTLCLDTAELIVAAVVLLFGTTSLSGPITQAIELTSSRVQTLDGTWTTRSVAE